MRLKANDLDPMGASLNIDTPQWLDVERAIQRLDGFRYTEVSLSDSDDTGMVICGGADRYLCQRIVDDNTTFLLLDPSGDEEREVFITKAGPGAEQYPEAWTVDLQTVLSAAYTFWQSSTLNPTLTWRHLGPTC